MRHRATSRRLLLVLIGALSLLRGADASAADEHLAIAKLQKAAVTCQKVIAQVGAKVLADKLKALDSCANAALVCVETKHDKPECLGKAGGTCAKQLDKAALALAKAQAKIVAAKSCGVELRLPDVLSADGLGLGDLAGDCQTDFGLDVCAGLDPLAACVVRTRDRAAGTIFGEARPRTSELLTLLPNVTLPTIAGLPLFVGCGTCSAPPESRKAVEQCGKALTKARQGLGASLEKTLAGCVAKTFACVQTKSDDPKCLTGATAGCGKAAGKVDAALAKFGAAVAKKCDAAAVDFAALGADSGLGLAPLAVTCTNAPTDAASLAACLQARAQCTTGDLVRGTLTRAGAFAESGHLGALAPDVTATCEPLQSSITARSATAPRAVFGSIIKFLKQVRRPAGASGTLVGGGRPNPSLGAGRGLTRVSGPSRFTFGGLGKIQFRYKVGGALSRTARAADPPAMIVAIQRADVTLDDHFEVVLAPPPGVAEVDDEIEVTFQDTIPGCAFSIALATRIDGVVSEYTPLLQVVDTQPQPTPIATPGPSPITRIIDANGDGAGKILSVPVAVGVDGSQNVYVAGGSSSNAFKITPGGTITQIIDILGDGAGNLLSLPSDLTVTASGTVYICSGSAGSPKNAFKITSGGTITKIIDASGDGSHGLDQLDGITVDGLENVYVVAFGTDNAFKITPGGIITQIIDASGDGSHPLDGPQGIAVDGTGNVYVTGYLSNNVFKIASGGGITQIIDASGDGAGHTLAGPPDVAVDATENAYVVGNSSANAFKITSGGGITQILDASGDGAGHTVAVPQAVAVHGTDVYVVDNSTRNGFKITSGGTITTIIDATGDGLGHTMTEPGDVAVDGIGNVYVSDRGTYNVFRIAP